MQVSETSADCPASDLSSFGVGQSHGWTLHGWPCTFLITVYIETCGLKMLESPLITDLQTTVEELLFLGYNSCSSSDSTPGVSATSGRAHWLQQVVVDASDETKAWLHVVPTLTSAASTLVFQKQQVSIVTLKQTSLCPPDDRNNHRKGSEREDSQSAIQLISLASTEDSLPRLSASDPGDGISPRTTGTYQRLRRLCFSWHSSYIPPLFHPFSSSYLPLSVP